MRMKTLAILLTSLILASAAGAAELPAERLGRPLRIHVARGLWWQMLRLHPAIGHLGGAEFSSSVDVYGSPSGYHGCARAMGSFPHRRGQLSEQDIIILAGSRVAALPAKTQTALVAWVKAGGGLLITGGPLSLDRDSYGPLATILPVTITKSPELALAKAAVLRPAKGSGLGKLDWSAKPRVYWIHQGVKPKARSQVLLSAGKAPILVTGKVGKGRIAVFAGTVCGDPAAGETAFWDWPGWPKAMSMILARLAPTAAIVLPRTPVPADKVRKARARLSEIGEDALDGLLDDEDDADKAAAGGTGKDLAKLAKLTRNADFARAVLQAVAGSNARLRPNEAEIIFRAVSPYLTPRLAAEPHRELMKSTAPGTVALGLRLAALGQRKDAGPFMVKIIAQGPRALQSDAAGGAIAKMKVPDGSDEGLRLAAAQALAELADPKLIPALRQALTRWQHGRDKTPMLADRQRDVEEMCMAALAAMGNPEAASWIVDRLIRNSREQEFAIDLSEHRTRNPSPGMVREQKQARERIGYLKGRNRRIQNVLRRLPPAAWSGLTAKAKEWRGEFATEALLLALAAGEPAKLSPAARKSLATIQQQTPVPAVRTLCRARLQNND